MTFRTMAAGSTLDDVHAPGARGSCALRSHDLVTALRADDREALATVFRAYGDRMRRIAVAITGSVAEADDVVQDVFLHLPDTIHTFEERCELWSWLRRVTLLLARMHVRARDRRQEVAIRRGGRSTACTDPSTIDRIALERALARLPAAYRTVVLLKELEGMSHAEIAETLGITANNSCVRLFRARQMLREALG